MNKNLIFSVIPRDFSKAGYVSLFKDVNIKYFGLNDGSKLEKEIDKNDIIINCIHDFGNQKFNLKLLETICNAAAGTKKESAAYQYHFFVSAVYK